MFARARLVDRVAWVAVWLLSMAAYMGVAVYWHARDWYRLTGDEPSYLLIAQSLLADGDLDVANDYAATGAPPDQWIHTVASSHGTFSVHNIGLPMLLAAPYALGGPLGARLWMAGMVALAPLTLYRVLRFELRSSGLAALVALTLSLSMPLLDGANQIYPDLVTGCLVLFAASHLWRPGPRPVRARGGELLFCLSLAVLPWLHIKNALPALVLLAGRAIMAPPARDACDIRPRPEGRKGALGSVRQRWGEWLAPLVAVGASLALLAAYNKFAFDRFRGPYGEPGRVSALSLEPGSNLQVLLGLHWDQAQGMFLQQPLWLLGLVGLIPFVASERQAVYGGDRSARMTWRCEFLAWRRPLFLGLLYASLIGPNCLHPSWYGGFSFAGRFAWSSVLLWVFPLAYSLRLLVTLGRWVMPALCGAAGALQVCLAQTWLRHDAYLLLSGYPAPAWAYSGLYPPRMRMHLPLWRHFPGLWEFPPNTAFLIFGAALVAAGWMLRTRRPALARSAVVALVTSGIGILLLSSHYATWTLPIDKAWGQTGQIEHGRRVAQQGQDQSGFLAIWPINSFPRGDYAVSLQYESRNADTAIVGAWDVLLDGGVWIANALPRDLPSSGEIQMEFHVPKRFETSPLEIRVHYAGKGELSITNATIDRVERR